MGPVKAERRTDGALTIRRAFGLEVVQELARNVIAATGGSLRDDATVLCADDYGPEARRGATGGASWARATRR